jgi:hypothetical protein
VAKNNHNINAFIAGEVSPKFYGRTTSQAFNDGCEELTNMINYNQGGVGRRTGTKFVHRILDENGDDVEKAAIFPFAGSDGSRWQIIITPEDPFSNSSESDPTIRSNVYAVNLADESVAFCKGRLLPDYFDGFYFPSTVDITKIQYAQDATNKIYFAHPDIPPFFIEYFPNRDGVSSNQFLFEARCFSRDSDLTLTLGAWRRMPYRPPSFGQTYPNTSTELRVNNSAGVYTLTEKGGASIFTPLWVGRQIKFTRNGTHAGVFEVSEFVGATSVKLLLIAGTGPGAGNTDYGATSTTHYYELGYWDQISGFPRTVNFYDNRLCFGGNKIFPEYVWFSELQNYNRFDFRGLETDSDFTDPLNTADAFDVNYRGGSRVNKVQFLQPSKTLLTGTNFAEFISFAPSGEAGVGGDNFRQNLESVHGAGYAQAARVENTTVYLQRDLATLREIIYNFNEDSYQSADLNIFNPDIVERSQSIRTSDDHIPRVKRAAMKQIVSQHSPFQRVWCVDNNGMLLCLARERRQEVVAWGFHQLAGEYTLSPIPWNGRPLKSFVHAISSNQFPDISGNDTTPEEDELWLVVTRGYQLDENDESRPVTYLERMYTPWSLPTIDDWDTSSDYKRVPIYMDCSVVRDHTTEPTDGGVIVNLPFSHGQVVTVLQNGKYLGEYTVDSGEIDISDKLYGNTSSWQVVIGLNYVSRVVPMCQELPAQIGTSQGLPRRVHEIVVHFFNTIGARFGLLIDEDDTPNTPDLEDVNFPDSENLDDPPLLFTGYRRLKMPLGYDERPRIVIESHLPYPMNVSHIVMKGVAYE